MPYVRFNILIDNINKDQRKRISILSTYCCYFTFSKNFVCLVITEYNEMSSLRYICDTEYREPVLLILTCVLPSFRSQQSKNNSPNAIRVSNILIINFR